MPSRPSAGSLGLEFPEAAASLPTAATSPAPGASVPPVAEPAPAPGPSLQPETDPDRVLAAIDWLRWGRGRGLSSEALLFAALAGTPPADGDHHGATPPGCRAELYRCLWLTAALPWTRRGLDVLAARYSTWAALRHDWDALAATMAAEIGPTWPEVDRTATGWFPATPNTVEALRRTLTRAGAAN